MKKPAQCLAFVLLFLAPWLTLYYWFFSAQTGKTCTAQVEVLDMGERSGPAHTSGLLTYRFESNERALLRFVGQLQVAGTASRQTYTINRTAEVALALVGDQVKTTTLGASPSYADNAPDELVFRYTHPSLQAGSRYHARLYRITKDLIATGTDFAPRNICKLTPPS